MLRVVSLLVALFAYLAATGGAMVFCSDSEGGRAIELAIGGAKCASSCTEGTTEETGDVPVPECVDEVLDVGEVRVFASAPICFPALNTLCGILPAPTLYPLQFEERKNDPPQHLALVATVVLVI